MKKRIMVKNQDDERDLIKNGRLVRMAITQLTEFLKTAHVPMESIEGLKVGGAWEQFSFPGIGSMTGEMYEGKDWKDFVTSPDGLDLDWSVYEWLMACPTLEKVNFKQLDRRKSLNQYS